MTWHIVKYDMDNTFNVDLYFHKFLEYDNNSYITFNGDIYF